MCDMIHLHVRHDSSIWVTCEVLHVTCEVSHAPQTWHLTSRHTCEWVMSHVNESCHMWGLTCASDVTSNVTSSNACLTCEWVMSHMWMSHVSHVNESCHTCEWVMLVTSSDAWTQCVSHMWGMTWLIHMCDMTHSHVWLVTTNDAWTQFFFIRVMWLIRMWHDSSKSVITYSCVSWLTHFCCRGHGRGIHMWRDFLLCKMYHSYGWVMSHM